MLKSKNIVGMLIFLSTSLSSFGTCPDSISIQKIWAEAKPVLLKKLIKQLKTCPNLVAEQAMTFHKLGLAYNNLGILDTAIYYTKNALAIRQKNFKPYHIDIARSHNNLGLFYKKQTQLSEAKAHCEKSLNIHKHNDNSFQWSTQKDVANIYFRLGDFRRSEMMSKELINHLEQSKTDTNLLALSYSDLGQCLNEQKKYATALSYLKKALTLLDKVSYENEAIFYLNLGTSYFSLKKYDTAIAAFQKANNLFLQEKKYFEAAKAYNNMGICFLKIKQYDQAKTLLQKGLDLAKKHQYEEIIAQSQDNIGELFFVKKNYIQALEQFEKAIKTLSKIPNFPSFQDLQYNVHKTDLITYLKDYARTMEQVFLISKKQKDVTKALAALRIADQLIDKIRTENIEQIGHLFWREQALPIYEQGISLCHHSKNPEAAYYFFEKSKSMLLLEAIQQSDALQALPEPLQQQYHELKKQLLAAQNNWNDVKEEHKATALKKLLETQANLDAFNQIIKVNYPNVYNLIIQPDLLSLSAFQDFLKEKQLAIQYFFGQHTIYALVIDSDNIWVHSYSNKDKLEKDIAGFLSFFEQSAAIENRPQDYLNLAQKLYQDLLGVLQKKGKNYEKLLLIPDGILSYLPFDALITNDATYFESAKYLIQQYEIRLGYSFTIAAKHLEKAANQEAQHFVAFAPFTTSKSKASDYTPILNDEIEELEHLFSSEIYKNKEATKAQFEKSIKAATVIHISSHAFSSPTAGKPHIVFFDEPFYLSDLYASELKADLIILSACQTNIGQHKAGEGIMSLSRGFTYAGARSLISSLWNVNAASTSEILVNFYKNLPSDISKNQALQMAKKTFLEQEDRLIYERSPYYWAGLTYYGDDKGLQLKQKNNSFFYVKITAVFLLFLGGIWLKFNPKFD